MRPVAFEPTISAVERLQTYALDRAATGTGFGVTYCLQISAFYLFQSPAHAQHFFDIIFQITHVRPAGESLTNYVALLWVKVGQPCFRPFWTTRYVQRSNCDGLTLTKSSTPCAWIINQYRSTHIVWWSKRMLCDILNRLDARVVRMTALLGRLAKKRTALCVLLTVHLDISISRNPNLIHELSSLYFVKHRYMFRSIYSPS